MEALTLFLGAFLVDHFEWVRLGWILLGTILLVSAANALNMWAERNADGNMKRTRLRPIPGGRVTPIQSFVFATLLGVTGGWVLYSQVNALTCALGLGSLLMYVGVYTPLKYVTPLALFVGSVPGAIPAFMGWTGFSNTLNLKGWLVFLLVFAWQLPHFLAISVYLDADYQRVGIKTYVNTSGLKLAKILAVGFSLLLFGVSLWLIPVAHLGLLYTSLAVVAGLGLVILSLQGLVLSSANVWARRIFFASLAYFPIILLGVGADLWVQRVLQ
jgi:protoheme IX farnesyltransferase